MERSIALDTLFCAQENRAQFTGSVSAHTARVVALLDAPHLMDQLSVYVDFIVVNIEGFCNSCLLTYRFLCSVQAVCALWYVHRCSMDLFIVLTRSSTTASCEQSAAYLRPSPVGILSLICAPVGLVLLHTLFLF